MDIIESELLDLASDVKEKIIRLEAENERLSKGLEIAEYQLRTLANSHLGRMLPLVRSKLFAIVGDITKVLESMEQ